MKLPATVPGGLDQALSFESLEPIELKPGEVTLVVVDMQAPFVESCHDPELVPNVLAQVRLAISRGWGIVILEVNPPLHGKTIGSVIDLLQGHYERFNVCSKEANDGSKQVLESCASFNYTDQFFRVVGVLIDSCVFDTVLGLTGRNKSCRVRVVKEACSTYHNPACAWSEFKLGPRVVVSSQSVDRHMPSKQL